MEERINEKKKLLQLKKEEYSQLTDILSSSNQFNYKIIKALKKQNLNIKKDTKNYINNCVERALYEAEYEYSKYILNNITDQTQYNKEIDNATKSREILLQKLEEYRQCRNQFVVNRNEISNESSRVKQNCLDAAFYCQDLKTKLSHDLKKSLNSSITYELTKNTKIHKKNLNDSISLVADRVIDSRQELKGYFKNQIMKLQREQRIMEETEAANKQKERIMAEENGASTKEDIEKYLKNNKLFGADRDDSINPETNNNNNSNNNGINMSDNNMGNNMSNNGIINNNLPMSPQSQIKNKLIPKPPTTPLLPSSNNNLSPRIGNLVTMTASSKRKIRGTQSAVLNLDDICDELLTVCQLEGKKYRLETLKKMLQSHIIYQISLLSLIKSDLHNINNKYQNMKNLNEKLSETINDGKEKFNHTDSTIILNQQNTFAQSESLSLNKLHSTTTNTATITSSSLKKNIRHVYVGDNLSMINDDDDDIDDINFPITQKTQYLSTGLLYAQSLSIEIEANESELKKFNEINDETLHSSCHQTHDINEINKLKEDHNLTVEKLNLLLDDSENNTSENIQTPLSTVPSSTSISQTSSPIIKSNRKTLSISDKNSTKKQDKVGYSMQNEMIQQLNKQKERDRERDLKFKEEKLKQRKRLLSDESNDYGVTSWCYEDRFKKMFIDILVSELNSSPDIPLEFGFVKLSSMSLMALDEQASNQNNYHNHHGEHNNHNDDKINGNSPTTGRRRSTYASQHRILLIEGLAAL